ncbi:MAG: SMC-Scp complex subunit ScpB [Candidatus Omnitrophica bacterium]|nr:SMC-Scp complex subunit ScpB [Candidatus Omnitrophota bacterium]
MDQIQFDYLKGAVEALLFVSEKPVTVEQLKDAIQGSHVPDLKEVLAALRKDYEGVGRGMVVAEIANGWQMLSSSTYAGYVREFYKTRHKEKLSRPALEALAIIAYKQPVSRTDVEVIRGVNSDGVVMHLLNKGLIKIAGRKEVPGRPYVYGTTAQFLEYFGLRALEDLPKLEEFPALMPKEGESGSAAVAETTLVPASATEAAAEPAGVACTEAVPEAASGAVAEQATVPTPTSPADFDQAELDRVHRELEEEMARARTRLDIEELEKRVEVSPDFMEPGLLGEASGQARRMGEGAGLAENAEGPADDASARE